MPAPPEKRPDRHYDFRRMNVWFAWSALALLVVTIWMIFADYAKPWKRYQARFRDQERQAVEVEMQQVAQGLDSQAVQAATERIERARAELEGRRGDIRQLEEQYVALDKKVYAADAEARAVKSLLDTARFEYGEALLAGGGEEEGEEVHELRVTWRDLRREVEELTRQRDAVSEQLAAERAALSAGEGSLAELRADLAALEQREATLAKKLPYFVLNAPLMDFVEPDLKVEQVMLPGLYNDINFTTVQRVDRCLTCHVAAGRPGFDGEEWEEPFRSHPRLDVFLSSSSPHPYTQYGCTVCHQGLDRATDFARSGHSPISADQRSEWTEALGWEKQQFLDTPIFPAAYSEAGCVGCHAAEVWTPGSEVQDIGRELVTRMGCYGCHVIDYPAFQELPRSGPSLDRVAAKTSAAWAYRWIAAPRDFHPTTWMPHFFFQENTEQPENVARQEAEISALVAYLWEHSEEVDYPAPPAGDAERGGELFETVGCTGCHILDAEASRDEFFPTINRLNGPNLVRTGSKVDAGWLYAWVRDPKQHNPATRMPDLRLTDQEAADVTAYLMASRDPAYEDLELPEVDQEVRDDLLLGYLQQTEGLIAGRATLEAMSAGERDQALGRQTIQKYGCYGCHEIRGFEDAQQIGVELTEEGSKPVHQFDFGHVHEVEHTRHDWIVNKLLAPRMWDREQEEVKEYGELLKMPNFGMSRREADAVLVNVLGFTKETALATRKAGRDPGTAALAAGRKLITWYNCQGCHLIEGEGRAIQTAIADPGLLPPNLAAQGARTQSGWLFSFLHDPSRVTLRPWLTVRMPTFGFTDDQVNALVGYFTAREGRAPFVSPPARPSGSRSLVVGEVTFNMLQCAKCHPSGPVGASGGVASAGELAPSLLLAPGRLRHDWVPSWILDPQSWVPGTQMPDNFPNQPDGTYQSPLAQAIAAPMFAEQKARMLTVFDSEEELDAYLADAAKVSEALRDHIWWNLSRGAPPNAAP